MAQGVRIRRAKRHLAHYTINYIVIIRMHSLRTPKMIFQRWKWTKEWTKWRKNKQNFTICLCLPVYWLSETDTFHSFSPFSSFNIHPFGQPILSMLSLRHNADNDYYYIIQAPDFRDGPRFGIILNCERWMKTKINCNVRSFPKLLIGAGFNQIENISIKFKSIKLMQTNDIDSSFFVCAVAFASPFCYIGNWQALKFIGPWTMFNLITI